MLTHCDSELVRQLINMSSKLHEKKTLALVREINVNWLHKAAIKKTIAAKLILLMQQNSTTIINNTKYN